MSKKSKIDIIKGLSRRKRKDDITKLPLEDIDGEDISTVDGVEQDFFVTFAEATLEDLEQFQLASMTRIAGDDGDMKVETTPVDAVMSLVDNKLLVDGRFPIIEEDDSIGFIRLSGSVKVIRDTINSQLSYAMAMVIMSMAMVHFGLSDGSDLEEVVDEAGN